MPRQLTAKQNKFIDGVVSGLSYSEAYRQAYDAENMARETIAVKASNLANRDNMRVIIGQRKKELADKAIWDRKQALGMLKRIACVGVAEEGLTKPQMYAVAIRAIKQANKMCGYNEPEKVEVSGEIKVTLSDDLEKWAK